MHSSINLSINSIPNISIKMPLGIYPPHLEGHLNIGVLFSLSSKALLLISSKINYFRQSLQKVSLQSYTIMSLD